MPTTIAIQSVTCENKSDYYDGFDEIWLLAQTDGDAGLKYPSSPVRAKKISKHDNRQTWKIDGAFQFTFSYCANLTLYEQDSKRTLQETDFVGNLRFVEGEMPITPATITNGSTTEYTVSYTYISN